MKKLLVLLFSISLLWSPSGFADDISDFSIEGISIGDSLLDYMTEDEILEQIEINKGRYYYLEEPDKYAHVNLYKNLKQYDSLSLFIKNNSPNKYVTDNNEKYTILSLRGSKPYIENFDDCIKERNEIVEILSRMFPNTERYEQTPVYTPDPSGNSIFNTIFFVFASGSQIDAYCTKLEKTFRIKKNWTEGLSVSLTSSVVSDWMNGKK